MRIRVDRDLCEANAVCQRAAPEMFKVDDDDRLHILVDELSEAQVERARIAVRRCPRRALSIVEE